MIIKTTTTIPVIISAPTRLMMNSRRLNKPPAAGGTAATTIGPGAGLFAEAWLFDRFTDPSSLSSLQPTKQGKRAKARVSATIKKNAGFLMASDRGMRLHARLILEKTVYSMARTVCMLPG